MATLEAFGIKHVLYPEQPPELDIKGGYIEFEGEEYVQAEQDAKGTVVLWSARVSGQESSSASVRILGEASSSILDTPSSGIPDDEYWDEQKPGSGSHLWQGSYRYISTDLRKPQIKMVGGVVPHAEFSLAVEEGEMDRVALALFVAATATSRIVEAFEAQPPLTLGHLLGLEQ